MGVLARVLEEAGIATVGLSLVRRQAENIKAPRFLHCEFPLGRPLGKPKDAAFQTDVIRRAFALLDRTDVPVLEDHPQTIEDQTEQPASCTLPPSHDPDAHGAVDEALGLRPAYNRQLEAVQGRTAMGRVGGPDDVAQLIEQMVMLAENGDLAQVGFDVLTVRAAAQDIRAYYEEAGLALSDHVPGARQIESWFYTQTKTGPILKAVSNSLKAAGEERETWYYMLPGSQQR